MCLTRKRSDSKKIEVYLSKAAKRYRLSRGIRSERKTITRFERKKAATLSKRKKTATINIVKPSVAANTLLVFSTGETDELGLSEKKLQCTEPTFFVTFNNEEIGDVFCDNMHHAAHTNEEKLWSWGYNDEQFLDRHGDEYIPARIDDMDNTRNVKLACCDSPTIAFSKHVQLFYWDVFHFTGDSLNKTIQKAFAVFEPIATFTISYAAVDSDHRLLLTRNDKVLTSDYHIMERLIINDLNPELLNIQNIRLISGGSYLSDFITGNNTFYIWYFDNFQHCNLADKENHEPTSKIITIFQNRDAIRDVKVGKLYLIILLKNGIVHSFSLVDFKQSCLTNESMEGHEIRYEKTFGALTQIPGLENTTRIMIGTNFEDPYALGNDFVDDGFLSISMIDIRLQHMTICIFASTQYSAILSTE